MKIVKVLFLDDAPWFLPDLSKHGIQLEVMQEGIWGSMDVYSAPRHVCEAVKKLTEGKEVDIVVVGNNMGAGVPKAQAIAEAMKEMTIVVWNSYFPGKEQPYAALGLKHFGSRRDLREMVPALARRRCLALLIRNFEAPCWYRRGFSLTKISYIFALWGKEKLPIGSFSLG